MFGYTPKLPLFKSAKEGYYGLIQDPIDVIKQNFKNLILTIPGERTMDPDFGVGLYGFLFELDDIELESKVSSKISEQVAMYMPDISIISVEFISSSGFDPYDFNPNKLRVKIEYEIVPLSETDVLEI